MYIPSVQRHAALGFDELVQIFLPKLECSPDLHMGAKFLEMLITPRLGHPEVGCRFLQREEGRTMDAFGRH
jgi:hypothetical protein